MAPITPIEAAVDLELSLDRAREARSKLRKTSTPGDPDRSAALEYRVAEINARMAPVRRLLGRLPYSDQVSADDEDRIRAASRAAQYERKQLKKMLRPEPSI